MTDFLHAYTMPENYAVEIPISKIICNEKIDPDYIQHLLKRVTDVPLIKPIVVIKHPKKDLYAVLDGHHRFHIAKLCGLETIKAAVIDDYSGLGFELTKSGMLQPSPEFTKYVRVPIKKFLKYIEDFLKDV